VTARRPLDVWLIDFTTVSCFFGLLEMHVGAVLDVFSRSIVAIRFMRGKPSTSWTCRLLEHALRSSRAGPRTVITDKGVQFKKRFLTLLEKHDIEHRFGALGRHGSIARIERFWRTLKLEWRLPAMTLWLAPALAARSLAAWAKWYQEHRPHQGLGGRTPEEVLRGRRPRDPITVGPHTRWRLDRELLSQEPRLPVYHLRRAA
jgi:transposase InsO family protein